MSIKINEFPLETLFEIFKYLTEDDLRYCRLTCKTFKLTIDGTFSKKLYGEKYFTYKENWHKEVNNNNPSPNSFEIKAKIKKDYQETKTSAKGEQLFFELFGGEKKFNELPVLNTDHLDPADLKYFNFQGFLPKEMTKRFMRGETIQGRKFFAIRAERIITKTKKKRIVTICQTFLFKYTESKSEVISRSPSGRRIIPVQSNCLIYEGKIYDKKAYESLKNLIKDGRNKHWICK